MSVKRAFRAALVMAAILLGVASASTANPGDWLAGLEGKTFGRIGEQGEASMLLRFESVPGEGFRVVETEQSGTSTTTIAASQRGLRWKGKLVVTPIDFKTRESVVLGEDGSLLLAWSSWGSTAERSFRLLPDGAMERRMRGDGGAWHTARLVLLDAERERLLVDQIAIEAEIFRQDVAARVKVLLAESEERRRQNREAFWNGLAQATVVLATAAAEVAAEMESGTSPGLAGVAFGPSTMPGPTPAPTPGPAPAAIEAPPAAAAPLRFVMLISLMNKPGDTVNPTCYSGIVTRPGPPGWGAPGFLPHGSSEQARQSVESLKDHFIAKCRASGREITGVGNFDYRWNQSPDDEQRVTGTRPRYAEDVLVHVD